MRRINVGMVLGGGAVLLLGAGRVAQADQSFSLDLNGTQSQTLAFSPFDTSLGTLNQVVITLSDPQAEGYAESDITSSAGDGYVVANLAPDLGIALSGTTLFSGQELATASCGVSDTDTTCTNTTSGQLFGPSGGAAFTPDPVDLTSPGDLALFSGPSDASLVASIANSPVTEQCMFYIGSGVCAVSGDATFSGTLDVSYDYTPATPSGVPEPASVALLAAGVAGLGMVRRRTPR